jgi:hypothetical protein
MTSSDNSLDNHYKFWCTFEDHLIIIKFNEFLNNNAKLHKRSYFAIKSRIQKLFYNKKRETKNIGINCNLDDEDLFDKLYPWLVVD